MSRFQQQADKELCALLLSYICLEGMPSLVSYRRCPKIVWARSSWLSAGEGLGTDFASLPRLVQMFIPGCSKKSARKLNWTEPLRHCMFTTALPEAENRDTYRHISLTVQLLESTSPLPFHKFRGFPQRAITRQSADSKRCCPELYLTQLQ